MMERLPKEALYISAGEMQLVERLLINDGELLLGDWDDLGAAEALVSRLWCSFHAEGDDWTLLLHRRCMIHWRSPSLRKKRKERASACFAMTRPSMACSISRGCCTRHSRSASSCTT